MKKLVGLLAILGVVLSLTADINYTNTADEAHPRPLVVDQI
ncbi:hypothetical protein ACJA3J_20115 [Halobacillus sp. SY10]|uniref:Phr family secreted Rap phosphatase inhibitor n=1 Tax=Halobacillus aidingensis TaxID=240303 RepID=A0A1H0TYF1_HALAD|nr:hypothetical protein [Halobacillus aidingensis]SDP58728.1 hypothetical protein SAMN05421677_12334 [Halobacillus aidingensis]